MDIGNEDPVRAVADEIGFARITSQFRAEIEGLVDYLKRVRNGERGD